MSQNPIADFWKSQTETYLRIMEDWQQALPSGESAAAGTQHAAELFGVMTQTMTGLAATAAEPLRVFLATQREMSEQLSRWAELYRQFAEQADAMAHQVGAMVDAIEPWADPVLQMSPQPPSEDSAARPEADPDRQPGDP